MEIPGMEVWRCVLTVKLKKSDVVEISTQHETIPFA
jgi:hypothetical protein